MSILYNSFSSLSSDLKNFFNSVCNISKPQNNFISNCIVGMINAESVVTTDIIKKIPRDRFDESLFASKEKKFYRFFNNTKFKAYDFYNDIITYLILNFKSKNPNIYIAFDHMYICDRFTILMFSLKVGKQGIPLWYRCFEGNSDIDAFKMDTIKEGILYVHNLFAAHNVKLNFLADRWFNFVDIMQYIDSLNDTYYIRTKTNLSIEIDNYKDSDIIHYLSDIEPLKTKSLYFENVRITKQKFQTNLTVSKLDSHDEPYFIFTNGKTSEAIKRYSYRFGSIECIFKNEKSNGFYLEATQTRNITALISLFTIMNVALVWLVILGVNYSKAGSKVSKYFKIDYSKKVNTASSSNTNANYTRFISLFNVGLLLFNLAYNSYFYYNLKTNFKLYDV